MSPDWSARVEASAAAQEASGGELGPAMSVVARQPTAVWLDSVEAILYDLPNRACLRAPSGDFGALGSGVADYRGTFVDPIVAILAEPRYRDLRVAVVGEPHALHGQFIQGVGLTAACEVFQQAGGLPEHDPVRAGPAARAAARVRVPGCRAVQRARSGFGFIRFVS